MEEPDRWSFINLIGVLLNWCLRVAAIEEPREDCISDHYVIVDHPYELNFFQAHRHQNFTHGKGVQQF